MTAKNSIKIKSFCFGTKLLAGVEVKGITVGISAADVGVREAGDGVTSLSCGAAQAAKKRVIKKTKIYRFIKTLARTDIIYITTWIRIN